MSDSSSPAKWFHVKPHFWLIFSLYYFMPLFFRDYSGLQLVVFFGAYGLFVACYLWACEVLLTPQRHWPILGIVAVAVAASWLTSSVDTLFMYASLFMGMCYSIRLFLPLLLALIAVIAGLSVYHGYPFPFLILTGTFGAVTMGLVGVAERTRLHMVQRDQRSREEVQQLAMIAERERIARDLHDILGHSLSSIALKAELAEKLINQNKTDEGQSHLAELKQIARESLHLVRETVSGYKHRGLTGEVMELCERLRQNNFAVTLEGEVPALNSKAETTLILALTELTTNVMRHSRGNECRLEFNRQQELLNISVTDNGPNAKIHLGNGLKGVQERLAAFNGNLEIDTGAQSRFTIALPATQMRAS